MRHAKDLALAAASVALVLAALLACKKKEGDTSNTSTTSASAGAAGQGATGTPAGEPPPGDKPGKGCTLPEGSIRANFTVTKGCTTHLKSGGLYVNDEATLTIEDGVKILAETDAFLWIEKGKLLVKGTAAAPVTFTSANSTKAPGDWVGIGFREGVMSGTAIEHAIIEYAGSKASGGQAAIQLENMRQGKRISITETQIASSGQFGVVANDNGTFARFENNKLSSNKSGSLDVPAEVLGSVSSANKLGDPIHVKDSHVDESTSWPAVDVAVVVDGNILVGATSSVPVLTIADKTLVKMSPGLYFSIGDGGAGALVAKNVTFTSASPSPAEGDWAGFFIHDKANGTNVDGCTVEYAGGKQGGARAVFTFWGVDAKNSKGVKIQNTTFRNIQAGAFASNDNDCGAFPGAGNKVEGADPLCVK